MQDNPIFYNGIYSDPAHKGYFYVLYIHQDRSVILYRVKGAKGIMWKADGELDANGVVHFTTTHKQPTSLPSKQALLDKGMIQWVTPSGEVQLCMHKKLLTPKITQYPVVEHARSTNNLYPVARIVKKSFIRHLPTTQKIIQQLPKPYPKPSFLETTSLSTITYLIAYGFSKLI